MDGQYKSLDSNRCAQVFANKSFFAAAYPVEKKSLAGQGMREFIGYFAVMDHLVCDGSKEQTSKGKDSMKEFRKHGIDLHITDTYCYKKSKVEGMIREIRKKCFCVMLRKNLPRKLWDYVRKWVA